MTDKTQSVPEVRVGDEEGVEMKETMATEVTREVTMYRSEEDAAQGGRRDGYCREVGSFVVAEMSDGSLDYFALGTPPHRRGQRDGGAGIIARYTYSHYRRPRWRRHDLNPCPRG